MRYKFKDISALVVENSAETFALARDVLATFGMRPIYSAFNIETGFEAYKTHGPDVILIDGVANFNDGLALTLKIRLDEGSPDPVIPIILMVRAPTKNQFFEARDAGISEFLVKPYTANSMLKKLESLLENPRPFVKAGSFFGPDRRSKKEAAFPGDDRRTKPPFIVDVKEARRLSKENAAQTKKSGGEESQG